MQSAVRCPTRSSPTVTPPGSCSPRASSARTAGAASRVSAASKPRARTVADVRMAPPRKPAASLSPVPPDSGVTAPNPRAMDLGTDGRHAPAAPVPHPQERRERDDAWMLDEDGPGAAVVIPILWATGPRASRAGLPEAEKVMLDAGAPADAFGTAVAIAGSRMAVGAPGSDDGRGRCTSTKRSAGPWTEVVTLDDPTATLDDAFGSTVALGESLLVVGAPYVDGAGTDTGAVYVFFGSGADWVLKQTLTASDAAAGDLFGSSVATSDGRILVGAPRDDDAGTSSGAAYVFEPAEGGWTEMTKLAAPNGASGDEFGRAVALDGSTAVIGAHQNDAAASNAGAAYVFFVSGSNWTVQGTLTASDASAGDRFGNAVAVDGDRVVVGASLDNAPSTDQGSAYVFLRSGSTWSHEAHLTSSDGAARDRLGHAAAIRGERIWLGAPGADTGVVRTYRVVNGSWTEGESFEATDGASGDAFGEAVALDGAEGVSGAPADDEERGAAYTYAYAVLAVICPPDATVECGASTDPDDTGWASMRRTSRAPSSPGRTRRRRPSAPRSA